MIRCRFVLVFLAAIVLAQVAPTTTTTLPAPETGIPPSETGTIVPQAHADALLCPLGQDTPLQPQTPDAHRACERRAAHLCAICVRRHWQSTVVCSAACDRAPCDPPLPTVEQCCAAGFPVIGPSGSLCPPNPGAGQ